MESSDDASSSQSDADSEFEHEELIAELDFVEANSEGSSMQTILYSAPDDAVSVCQKIISFHLFPPLEMCHRAMSAQEEESEGGGHPDLHPEMISPHQELGYAALQACSYANCVYALLPTV